MATDEQILPFNSSHIVSASPLLSGPSPAATRLRAQVRRIAPYFHVVCLTGEHGCADDAIARALHHLCPLHDRAFATLSAAEAEARFAVPGPQHATEGLLYLREADHLSPAAQAGLLRLLQDHRSRTQPLTRIVAYTGRGLKPLISAGLFSAELAGLLGALQIALPPLRERKADLPLLLHTCLKEAAHGLATRPPYLSDAFLQAATAYAWPGNLDQLESVVVWLLDARTGTLQASDLAAALDATGRVTPQDEQQTRLVRLDAVVQQHIRSVLMACNGNKLRAAEVLGISRSTLYRMLDSVTSFNPLQLAG